MQPRPRADTSRLLFPSLRFCIFGSFLAGFSAFEIRIRRCGNGSPILPIYCLFLLPAKESLARLPSNTYPRPWTEEDRTMRKPIRNAAQGSDQIRQWQSELACRIASIVGSEEKLTTDVRGLTLFRRTAPIGPTLGSYDPSIALVAQGRKHVTLGRSTFLLDASRYLLTSLDLPIIGEVLEASEQTPYM